MDFLTNAIARIPAFQQLKEAVDLNRFPACVSGVSAVHKANMIYSLCDLSKHRAFVVAADEGEVQKLSRDLEAMGMKPLLYPLRDFSFRGGASMSKDYEHARLSALYEITQNNCNCIITCIDAALQHTIAKKDLLSFVFTLESEQELSLPEISEKLILMGYEKAPQTEGIGQFSARGGILDIFPPQSSQPIRIELWGDEIDTIAYFDPVTQRRGDTIPKVTILPATEAVVPHPGVLQRKIETLSNSLRGKIAVKAKEILQGELEMLKNKVTLPNMDKFLPLIRDKAETLFDYLDDSWLLFVSELSRVKEKEKAFTWQQSEDIKDLLNDGILCKGLDRYAEDWAYALSRFSDGKTVFLDVFSRGTYDTPIRFSTVFNARQLSPWSGSITQLAEDLPAVLYNNWACVVLAGNERSAKNTVEDLRHNKIDAVFEAAPKDIPKGKVVVTTGSLTSGLEYPAASFTLITHGQLLTAKKQKKHKVKNAKNIYSLAELTQGDYVVHAAHGIGIFDGIHKIDMQGITKDYIKIKYAKSDILYVPVTQLDLVSKYIGAKDDAAVKVHKLGGTEWQKAKARVRSGVKDIAKDLIALYAERMKAQGYAFSKDTEWQHDFEAHFEYEETDDQLRCIDEIKSDMERSVPMDRLLCGDVGFGKTEVALRAAFKCIADGKQCALLVPTTILAWQHYQTILRRMEAFPVRVELLSRFRTPKQQAAIIKKLQRGDLDMVVGTHRIVSKDVNFKDLGLVIIDEEQRFGVAQKEHLKNLRKNVDVLTLSATPIPRTLSMALSGIRDMSVIEEAPHDRYPVQSYVLEFDKGILADAIRKELRRGGQVYYLHNDIASLEQTAGWIRAQIPDARIGIAHGKMNEGELSELWRQLLEQELDILVCTTIIETGVDVPNVNTLIIDNADRMGLSQLHQLRGRVGRSSRRAYAYFTFTPNKVLSEISQKRLSAIREFTEFGSGFKIAMRDLELRGAGNILGGEQHGQMESVGYDLYLKLLDEAIAVEKGETPSTLPDEECLIDIQIQAHIPDRYIENLSQRIDIYRRIADIRSEEDAGDVMDELIDRFGDPPQAVQGLIEVALLRNRANALGIYEIKQQEKLILFRPYQLDLKIIAGLSETLRNLVTFGTGQKPYIGVKTPAQIDALEVIRETLKLMENCLKE